MTVNKIDRCFLELMLEREEAYLSYRRVVGWSGRGVVACGGERGGGRVPGEKEFACAFLGLCRLSVVAAGRGCQRVAASGVVASGGGGCKRLSTACLLRAVRPRRWRTPT